MTMTSGKISHVGMSIRLRAQIQDPAAYDIAKEILLPLAYGITLDEEEPGIRAARFNVHPASPPVYLIEEEGRAEIESQTSMAGPGYHHLMASKFQEIQDSSHFEWTTDDETQYVSNHDFEDLTDQFRQIVLSMAEVHHQRKPGQTISFGIPSRIHYHAPGDTLTHVGPLTHEDWAHIRAAKDFPNRLLPFPDREETPKNALGFGIAALTTDFPDREPANNEERKLFQRIHESLWLAHQAGLDAQIPYGTWSKLLPYVQCSNLQQVEIGSRSQSQRTNEFLLYRHYPMTITVFGRFKLIMPGNSVIEWPFGSHSFAVTSNEASVRCRDIDPDADFLAFSRQNEPATIPNLQFEATAAWSKKQENCLYLLTRQGDEAFFFTLTTSIPNSRTIIVALAQSIAMT